MVASIEVQLDVDTNSEILHIYTNTDIQWQTLDLNIFLQESSSVESEQSHFFFCGLIHQITQCVLFLPIFFFFVSFRLLIVITSLYLELLETFHLFDENIAEKLVQRIF